MNSEDFKNWRKQMGFNQQQAANALGISKGSVENYEKGQRREDGREVVIPLTVALACSAVAKELTPWPLYNEISDKWLKQQLRDVYILVSENYINQLAVDESMIWNALNKTFRMNQHAHKYSDVVVELKTKFDQYMPLYAPLIEASEDKDEERFISLTYDLLEYVRQQLEER